ncbi:MAG: hypothetical protein U0X74_08705 [Anaerolineales bacterium]
MTGDFWTSLFYSLFTELFVALIAFFVKDNRRLQIQILAIGTILAGSVAFINPSTLFSATPTPTNIPIVINTETPAPLAYQPLADYSNAPSFFMFPSSSRLDGPQAITIWFMLVICPNCDENSSFNLYTSPNELEAYSSQWIFSRKINVEPFPASPGVWYKLELLDPSGEPYPYSSVQTIHCCEGN